jgi:hypothetical protein
MKETELRHEQVFRPPYARSLAVVWFLIALFVTYDTLRRGSGRPMWVALAVLAFSCALVYALAFRPAVVVDDEAVTLRNILRDVRVPWGRVTRIGSAWSLTVDTDRKSWGSWAITARNRERGEVYRRGVAFGGSMGARLGGGTGSSPAPAYGGAGAGSDGEGGTTYVSVELSRRWDAALSRSQSAPDEAAPVVVTWVRSVVAALGASTLLLALALLL